VDVLDTASAYGDAETRIGLLLAGAASPPRVVTKALPEIDAQTASPDAMATATISCVERSLSRLDTAMDTVLLHREALRKLAGGAA
jgi:aryl-alcohol dehydrogenase-like predicted oxidoreductase